MRLVRSFALPALSLAAMAGVSSASAAASWGAIAYTQDGRTFRFTDYQTKEQLLSEAKIKFDSRADLLLLASGECGAVAEYHDPFGEDRVVADKGHSAEEAARNALDPARNRPDQASEHPNLLNSYCQK